MAESCAILNGQYGFLQSGWNLATLGFVENYLAETPPGYFLFIGVMGPTYLAVCIDIDNGFPWRSSIKICCMAATRSG